MADLIPRAYKARLAGLLAAIDLDTDDLKVMLLGAGYTPSALHDFRDDLTPNEVAPSGSYVAGGSSLAGKTITLGSGADADNYIFDANDVAWTGATIAARYAAIYKNVGTAATDPIVGIWDFGATITSTNGTFTIQWNASGILKFAS